ncbi:hypothetical protein FE782_14645 [Paenibacillus antri]|uniref:Lipoprotein n=1 Tax=Paenibacillus antri TaxID=2582848 RepID=A0A5R9GF93_9BACL|nr:hypothetical protein [Paenibacillus antri]TLS51353.1 hypothetical protein FE782_14645 [Paenibacillus antri]
MSYKLIGMLLAVGAIAAGCMAAPGERPILPAKAQIESAQESNPERKPDPAEASYADESKYVGEELKLIQTINRSVRFQNEGDQDGYMSLLAENSNMGFPASKVRKIEVVGIRLHTPKELSAIVTTRTWLEGDGDIYSDGFYLLSKEEEEWRIVDKD